MDKYSDDQYIATVSVVVPVYQGEKTISTLVSELAPYVDVSTSPSGIKYVINEVLLVHDSGPDNSANVILTGFVQCGYRVISDNTLRLWQVCRQAFLIGLSH
jgi:hypothetical protein